jgi:RNA polymerase sigma factor (sigma-70 family)
MTTAESVRQIDPNTGVESMQQSAVPLEAAPESEESVIRRYDRLISFLARRFRVDTDDLVQIGRIELLRSLRDWQEKPHNALFWTYARKAVVGAMINHVTREAGRYAWETDPGFNEPASSFCPPDQSLEVREHIASLSDRDASIFEMYVAGFNADEIAERNGVSRPRVYQILASSVEKLRGRA